MSPYHNVNKFNGISNGYQEPEDLNKRPVQKVTPSRSAATYQSNGNHLNGNSNDCGYTKPNSPIKMSQGGILQHNNVPNKSSTAVNGHKPLTATVGYVNNAKAGQKPNKWVLPDDCGF